MKDNFNKKQVLKLTDYSTSEEELMKIHNEKRDKALKQKEEQRIMELEDLEKSCQEDNDGELPKKAGHFANHGEFRELFHTWKL